MKTTEYSWMTTEELLEHAFMQESPTNLECELANRLTVAMDMLEEGLGNVDPRG